MNGMHSGGSNRKFVGGVVVVIGIGLVIAVLASGTSLLAFVPFLLLLACPLMMIFMMGSMGHYHMAGSNEQPGSDGSTPSDLPNMAGLSRDQRV